MFQAPCSAQLFFHRPVTHRDNARCIFQKSFPTYQTIQIIVLRFIMLFACAARSMGDFSMYYEFLAQFRVQLPEKQSQKFETSPHAAPYLIITERSGAKERPIFISNRAELSRGGGGSGARNSRVSKSALCINRSARRKRF